MKQLLVIIYIIVPFFVCSQEEKSKDSLLYNDPKYREDQFYTGITYNILQNNISGFSQQGFSGGLHLGVIRDIPFNKSRNIGVGIGLGYSNNSYNHNLLIQENEGGYDYEILNSSSNYTKNKFNTHLIELPIQFRWRTSTAESHKFWRIYTGVKLAYVFYHVARHRGEAGNFNLKNLSNFNKFQPSIDLGFGWNTWNFYASYGFESFFDDTVTINGEKQRLNSLKIGLMFYVF